MSNIQLDALKKALVEAKVDLNRPTAITKSRYFYSHEQFENLNFLLSEALTMCFVMSLENKDE